MIAKLEWTLSNAQQDMKQLQTPTMGVTINNKQIQRINAPRHFMFVFEYMSYHETT